MANLVEHPGMADVRAEPRAVLTLDVWGISHSQSGQC